MNRKIYQIISSIFFFVYLLLFNSSSFAQTTANANICTQTQCVKLQNGYLWVLSSDNVSYTPYFIKAVGYEPIPVGRYPSDWGYPLTDPRSANNNIYDDPNILNRDFSLLQQMNANTIRVWAGDKTTVSCPCPNNGRFTNYITNAGTTINSDTTQNTLDLAASYGLKVIAGFSVNFLTFDANNNIGSVDSNGNALTRQQVINSFVNYVNTFKGNRAILFWAIGNENNYEVLGAGTVTITAFENTFGLSYGDTIFNWLEQTGNVLNFDGGIIVDLNSSTVVNLLKAQYPADYNSILTVLKQFSGQNLTSQQLAAWYSLVDDMAKAAHAAEGATFHPVALVNGGVTEIGNTADGAADSQLPDLDIWGANVYLGQSFGPLFSNYAAQSHKPLWISEFGVDAWSTIDATDINAWGITLADDLNGTGMYDPATQSTWDVDLWNEISNNFPVTIGGSVMEYSDEWWKPYEFYCTNPNVSQTNNTTSSDVCNSNHKYFGFPNFVSSDSFSNEEWYGIMSISPNPVAGDPDVLSPRTVYNNLQTQWQANPWPSLTLNITGSGTGIITSSTSLGPGLNCSVFSGVSTGNCSAAFAKNQSVTLSFSSNTKSTVTDWGVNGCVSGSTTCNITPDTNLILNLILTASSGATVTLTTPDNSTSYTAPSSITLTANTTSTATINKISFYNGTTLLGTFAIIPKNSYPAAEISNLPVGVKPSGGAISGSYNYIWKNPVPGTYNLTVVVTNSSGVATTSSPVSVTVNPQGTYTITATAGSNGSISPSGVTTVNSGGSQTYLFIPNTGYQIAGVTVNGTALTGDVPTSYTFSNVTSNQTIGVTFTAATCPANMFFDTTKGDSTYNSCACDAGAYFVSKTAGCAYCPTGQTYNGTNCVAATCPANMFFDTTPGDSTFNSCACDAGAYFVSSTAGCAYCPVGETSKDAKTCTAITCPANMYFDTTPGDSTYNSCACDAGSYFVSNTTGCAYCPVGQTYNGTSCVAITCPKNMYFDTTPADKTYNSCACDAGSYFVSNTAGCAYCPVGQTYNGTSCVAITCPANMYYDTTPGDSTYNSCACNGGAYFVSSTAGCAYCPVGQTSNDAKTCVPITCASNMYFDTTPTDSTYKSCACNAGAYFVSSTAGCAYCPVGQTSNDAKTCVPITCASNMYFDTTPTDSTYKSCACNAGAYFVSSTAGCAYCPVGQTSNDAKTCVPITCASNMYFDTTPTDSTYKSCACNAGAYFVSSTAGCAYCPVGQTSNDAKTCVPITCASNMYFDTTPTDSTYKSCACNAGAYFVSSTAGCAYCPVGQTSNDAKTCVPITCAANMYFDTTPTDSTYKSCACDAGSYFVSSTAGCAYCPVGQTSNDAKTCVPITCAANMYFDTTPTDSTYKSCACNAGAYFVSSTAGCAYCPVGQTSNDAKTCVPITCAANMYFDTTPTDSTYKSCACDAGSYFVSSTAGCAYCPVGQTYNGTSCVAITCPSNMYYNTTPGTPGYNSCQCDSGSTYVGPGCVYKDQCVKVLTFCL